MKFSQGNVLEWTKNDIGQNRVERYDFTGDDRANSSAVDILRKLLKTGSFYNPVPESLVPEPGTVHVEMIDRMLKEHNYKLFFHEQNNIIFSNLSKIIAGELLYHAQFHRIHCYPDRTDEEWAELLEIFLSAKGSFLAYDDVSVMIPTTPRFALDRLGNLFVGNTFKVLPMSIIESEY